MSNTKQSSVEKEFIPYEEAFALKELGFDEPCFGRFSNEGNLVIAHTEKYIISDGVDRSEFFTQAPTFSQAFRFFRKKYNLVIVIKPIDDKRLELGYNLTKNGLIIQACTTYENAELFSVRNLIKIVKQGGNK